MAWAAVPEAAEAGTPAKVFLGINNFSEAGNLVKVISKLFHVAYLSRSFSLPDN